MDEATISGEERRARRHELARELAEVRGGVIHRADLRAGGVSRFDVRNEIAAGRWSSAGRHTVVVGPGEPEGIGRWWHAVWESGAGAVLNGATALLAHGMKSFTETRIDVSLPATSRCHVVDGVRLHRHRQMDPVSAAGVPRVRPELATIRAAQWAVSDCQAALLICLPVQQRLVSPDRLLAAWRGISRSPRHALLDRVMVDVCDGAHSLGELDFGELCRRRGFPVPLRQSMRVLPDGRAYLDAEFEGGAVVEIDGSHHWLALSPVDDALRANELTLASSSVLRIPVLGLHLEEERFMAQVGRLLAGCGDARGAPLRTPGIAPAAEPEP